MHQHINALNERQRFLATFKGVLSPMEKYLRQIERQMVRRQKRTTRMAHWEHCGARQRARYARNQMHIQQQNSHKPPAIWPRGIGPNPHA